MAVLNVEPEFVKDSLCKAGRVQAAVHRLARIRKGLASDPISAALITKNVTPAANTVNHPLGISRPCHRPSSREKKNPGTVAKRAVQRHLYVVLNRERP